MPLISSAVLLHNYIRGENDDDGDGDEEEAENDDIFCCISLLYLLICAHCLLSVFMQPYLQIGFLKL